MEDDNNQIALLRKLLTREDVQTQDVHDQAILAFVQGFSCRVTARVLNDLDYKISKSTINRWKQRHEAGRDTRTRSHPRVPSGDVEIVSSEERSRTVSVLARVGNRCQYSLDFKDKLKDIVSNLDARTRAMESIFAMTCRELVSFSSLAKSSRSRTRAQIFGACARRLDEELSYVGTAFEEIQEKIEGKSIESCEFSGIWRYSLSQSIQYLALSYWMTTGTLIGLDAVIRSLGFTISAETYATGVSGIGHDLARLCVNLVSAEEVVVAIEVGEFVRNLSASFRLLNLKNNALRRKVDALKYAERRVEDVFFECKVRNMIPS